METENFKNLMFVWREKSPTTREFDKPALLKQSKKPLLHKGLSYNSDWARTSDRYPVKVAIMF
uniref:hypothetical protein n=1 Tax=Bacillus subtilis TaxID=1423 RepID=UPI00254B7E01|nr:hypothetical protein [Bacillus subtilis]